MRSNFYFSYERWLGKSGKSVFYLSQVALSRTWHLAKDENRDQQQLGKQQGVCVINTACCNNLCFEGCRSSLVLLEIMMLQPGAVKTVGSFMYSSICFRGNTVSFCHAFCGTEAPSR